MKHSNDIWGMMWGEPELKQLLYMALHLAHTLKETLCVMLPHGR